MPDTAPDQGAYPQPSGQKAGCGFPRLKVVALFSLASGASIRSCGCTKPGASIGGAASAWGKADRLVEWPKPRSRPRLLSAEAFAASPATLPVRHVRLQARLKGFRTRTLVLATTLGDPVAYPAEAPAELYLQRWGARVALPGTRRPSCAWTCYAAARRS
jgi:hypothetical protein